MSPPIIVSGAIIGSNGDTSTWPPPSRGAHFTKNSQDGKVAAPVNHPPGGSALRPTPPVLHSAKQVWGIRLQSARQRPQGPSEAEGGWGKQREHYAKKVLISITTFRLSGIFPTKSGLASKMLWTTSEIGSVGEFVKCVLMINVIAGEASCRVCGGGYQVWRTTCWCHQVCGGWHLFIMFTIYWSDSRSVVEDLKVRVKPSVDIVIGDIQDQVKPAVEKVVDNLKENVSVKIDSKENTDEYFFLQLRSWFSSFDTEGFFWDINGQFWKPSLLISITLLLVNKYVENIYLYYFLLSILWTELQLVVARGFGDWEGQWGWGRESGERHGDSDNSHLLATAEAATNISIIQKTFIHWLQTLFCQCWMTWELILLWSCEIMTLPHSGVSRTHITHTQTKLVSYEIDAEGMMDKKIRYERKDSWHSNMYIY